MVTYARARLWVGISSVGTWVVLSLFLLLSIQTISKEFQSLSLLSSIFVFLGLYTIVSLPFDCIGGYLLPRKYGRSKQTFGQYLLSYLRGLFFYELFLFGVSYILLSIFTSSANENILLYLFIFVSLLQIQLAFFQKNIARLLAKFPVEKPNVSTYPYEVWGSSDIGFTGGISLFQSETIVPKKWIESFSKEDIQQILHRREFLRKNKSHSYGIWGAILFNTIGLLFGYLGCVATGITLEENGYLSYLLIWSSSVSLWGFLGLLILPSLSQKGTLAADSAWIQEDKEKMSHLLTKLDAYQDQEPTRQPQIQKIFHPIASVAIRQDNLGKGNTVSFATWHIARYTLFFSISILSFLGRAVHCNVGRPELWVFLPSDG